ncbi:SpoIIE family protein phosphatase [Sphaerisporangium fuscum]|uniref:SpoIIE family protein phosphatase n=1 Tax=Sphaerisporangium fuscum TaxID=2835868 RepID=UPI001BDC0865|nr:SpoIIE family protein phosphatase [Sphaerisporangium fuscum]
MSRSTDQLAGGELLDDELATAVRRTGASGGGVYLLTRQEPVLSLVVTCGSLVEFALPWQRLPLDTPTPISDAVRQKRLAWVGRQEDLVRSYPRLAAAFPYPLSLAAVPLTGSRDCWGALVLIWLDSHPPHITPREHGTITTSARRLARLLDDAVPPPAIPDQPRVAPLHRTHLVQPGLAAADFAERLPGALAMDLEGHVTFLTGRAAELLGRDADQLLGTLPWQSLPWLDDPVYEDRYRAAVVTRRPVSYTVLRPPDRRLLIQLYPDASGISALISPAEPGPAPPATSAVPSRGVPAGGVGRLYQLIHLAAALTETVGVQDVVDLVADQVLPAFGADGMVMNTLDAGRLKIIGHRGYELRRIRALDGLPLHTDLTPVGQVLSTGAPAFYVDAEQLARTYPQAVALSGKQAWAFLPLITSGRPVGCCVISYRHPRAFTADERATLTSLAGLIAQALDRARLYDAKQDLAHSLQQALLPHALPAIPGLTAAGRYLPATHGMDVGGDFYDLIRVDDTAAAVIGDVQGHNVTAAALMGQVRTAVHAHATSGALPEEVLARTNRVLADLATDLFVSCLYVHLDLAGRRARLASAGHLPPLLRHPGGRTEVLKLSPGLLMGIDPAACYDSVDIPLPPGTLLALYTDGLVETPGTDLGQTTADLAARLRLAPEQDVDGLADTLIRQATQSASRNDDIALLLINTDPRPAGGDPEAS